MKHGQKEGTKEEIIYKNGSLEKNMIPIQWFCTATCDASIILSAINSNYMACLTLSIIISKSIFFIRRRQGHKSNK